MRTSVIASVAVHGTSMSTWAFVAIIVGALFLGFCAGAGISLSGSRARHGDGKPWWYDVAFPAPDEATIGALKVLADRYALGEIDADEFHSRSAALRSAAPEPAKGSARHGK